jgi:hypothetical protein
VNTSRLIAPLVVILTVWATGPAHAQYTWTGGAGNGNWNVAGNWTGGVPQSGTSTIVTLAGTAQTSTAMNLSAPFVLNQLLLGSTATNGFSVGGGQLRFAGSGTAITLADGAGPLLLSSAVDFAAPTAISVTTASATVPYDLVFSGALTGTGALTFNGDPFANYAITGRNNAHSGSVTVTAGALFLAGANALGRTSAVTVGGNGILSTFAPASAGQGVAGGASTQAIGRLSATASGALVQIGSATSAAALLVGFDTAAQDFSYAGRLLASSTGSHLAKVGPRTLTLTGNTTGFNGTLAVRGGTVALQGAGTLLGSSAGEITLSSLATLLLDNSGTNLTDRLPDVSPLNLVGGTFRVIGSGAGVTTETLGNLVVTGGQSTVQGDANPGQGLRITLASANPGPGTVFFRGPNLGQAPGAGVTNVLFTAALPLVGGGGSGPQTSILPWGLGSSTAGASPDTFVTVGANGVRPLNPGTEYATYATAGATNNVREAGGFTVAAADTRNSLVTTGGAAQTVTLNANLTLTSGALLNTGAGTQITGTGTLLFGAAGAATGYVTTEGGLTLAAPASAAGLVKSGAGAFTVQRPVAVSGGVVAVAAGTLAIQNNGTTTTGGFTSPAGVTYRVTPGAALDVTGVTAGGGFTVGPNTLLVGGGTVNGTVAVSGTGTVEPTALPGPGVLSVGAMTWLPGGSYRWQISSAQGADDGITQSKLVGTGALDLTGLSAANRFNIRIVPLAPNNAPGGVYDFDNSRSYSWPIATFGSITGFAADRFTIDSAAFAAVNPLGNGTFGITQSGATLLLTFTPVPEPGVCLLLAVGGLFAARTVRRRAARAG